MSKGMASNKTALQNFRQCLKFSLQHDLKVVSRTTFSPLLTQCTKPTFALLETALQNFRQCLKFFTMDETMPQSGERNQRITALAVTGTQPWVKQAPWALRNPRLLDATMNRTALAVAGKRPASRFESKSYSNIQLAIFATVSRKFTYHMFNLLNKKQLESFLIKEVKEMGNMNKIRTFVIIPEHVSFQILVNFLDASRKFNTYIFPMNKQMEDFRLQEVKEMGL